MILDLSMRLKQLRNGKHLKQEQVADLIGVTKSAVSAYENDLRQPSYETLIRLANLYNVSTDYLLGRSDMVSLDLSDLTIAEQTLVRELVASMRERNRKLVQFYEK